MRFKLTTPDLAVQGKFLLVSNRIEFGHLVDADGFDTSRLYSEMWQIFTNPWDWERCYIHENYSRALDENIPVAEVGRVRRTVLLFALFVYKWFNSMDERNKRT